MVKEISERLRFLSDVGVGYLTLHRASATLSGGEAQRIRLATQIGSALVGVLYILDEPSIGLHQRDNRRLLDTLLRLRDLGNTVIVVEHDEETMRSADHIVDMGPGAGEHGGRVVAEGPPAFIAACEESLTGRFLAGLRSIQTPGQRRLPLEWFTVRGARMHNLRGIDVAFPSGCFTCVTGVSGSGKSTLVNDILFKGMAMRVTRGTKLRPGEHDGITGPSSSTRSSTSTSHPSDVRHARTRPPTPVSSTTSASSSPLRPSRRCAATSPGASASMSRAAAAKPARATGS